MCNTAAGAGDMVYDSAIHHQAKVLGQHRVIAASQRYRKMCITFVATSV
jgi:hypothetical protein